ncbi:hypothetical protein, partial [Halobacillus sp. BBL2006]|uniref:hypothetical protein n=1 Tax=Halobacillus sp. BBL2006 TaxID=1543706 RepID=UPI000543422C
VYHGRKIRGRVNRTRNLEAHEISPQLIQPSDEDHNENRSLMSGGTTLSISRNNVLIEDAEKEAARMIKAAGALGLSKINITIEK